MVVMMILTCGLDWRKALTSGAAATVSPTETACIQMAAECMNQLNELMAEAKQSIEETEVAQAAPSNPISKTMIKIGSKIIFKTAGTSIVTIATVA